MLSDLDRMTADADTALRVLQQYGGAQAFPPSPACPPMMLSLLLLGASIPLGLILQLLSSPQKADTAPSTSAYLSAPSACMPLLAPSDPVQRQPMQAGCAPCGWGPCGKHACAESGARLLRTPQARMRWSCRRRGP
jgi:hypothetical protein